MGPSQPKTLGSLNGVTRLKRNMLMGSILPLSIIGPPSPGPHSRLCLPKDHSQLANINPTYESSSVNCCVDDWFVPGGRTGYWFTVGITSRGDRGSDARLGAVGGFP